MTRGLRTQLARQETRDLAILLGLAILLRAALVIAFPCIDHPDEIFQSTEQAHRWLFGYGVVPWEFRDGVRSWILPGLTALFMAPAEALFQRPDLYLKAVGLGFGLLSLIQVWAAYEIGRPLGRGHALLAGFAVAVCFDVVFFAVRPLSEPVATSALLVAIMLLTGAERDRRRMLLGGMALGTVFILRLHLAPALALIAAMSGGLRFKARWLPMMIGAAMPVAVLGLLDWITWGEPFHSVIAYLRADIVEDVSSHHGTAATLWYLAAVIVRWGFLAPVVFLMLIPGTPKKPILLYVALIIFVSHSLVPHKEYRFILPALACFAVLAAIGLAETIAILKARLPKVAPALLPLAFLILAGGSISIALSAEGQKRLTAERGNLAASAALYRADDLCGLAYDLPWWQTPGYSGLHRHVPFYVWGTVKGGHEAAANYVVSFSANLPATGYGLVACYAQGPSPAACVYRREGSCTAEPSLEINEELQRRGQ